MPLTDRQLRIIIALRIDVGWESCNSGHIMQVDGQIRGLIFALTGKVVAPSRLATDYLDAAGIPWKPMDDTGGITILPEWCREMGFETWEEDEPLRHPEFTESW